MIRRKKLVMILILVLIVAIAVISVGYAALNSVLNITSNKVTQSPMSWDIGFRQETVTGTATNIGGTGTINCGTATATATTISGVAPVFDTAAGRCVYSFRILNNGTIGGKISSINITKPNSSCTISGSSMNCGNYEYRLVYNGVTGTPVAVNDTIAGKTGSTATSKIVVLMVQNAYVSSSNTLQSSFAYQITFAQN